MQGSADKEIPKIIHSNWAGGKLSLRDAGINNLSAWAKENPGFKIYLWVDPLTAKEDMVENYKIEFSKRGLKVFTDDPGDIGQESAIVLMDIRKHGIARANDLYEIKLLKPNFGKSSDSERYDELDIGGVYIDCTDVCPAVPLIKSGLFDKKHANHILCVDHLSQNLNPQEPELKDFNLERVGNDAFICTKGNPLMRKISVLAKESYDLKEIGEMIKVAYCSHDIQGQTINTTGPGLIQRVLKDSKKVASHFELQLGDELIEIQPLRTINAQFVQSVKNTRNWLGVPVTHWSRLHNDKEAAQNIALDKVMAAIQYEMEHFKIMRLDTHIKQLSQCLECDPNLASKLLLAKLTSFPISKDIGVVQLTCEFEDTILFCKMNNLLPKCCCSPTKDNPYFNQVLYAATSCDVFQLIILSGVEKLAADSKDELKGFASWMNDGLKFIEDILKVYNENITSEALNECQRILEGVYVSVIPELNKLLDDADKVDEKKFKSVHKAVSQMLDAVYEKEEQAFTLSLSQSSVSDTKKSDDKKEGKPPPSNTPTGY